MKSCQEVLQNDCRKTLLASLQKFGVEAHGPHEFEWQVLSRDMAMAFSILLDTRAARAAVFLLHMLSPSLPPLF